MIDTFCIFFFFCLLKTIWKHYRAQLSVVGVFYTAKVSWDEPPQENKVVKLKNAGINELAQFTVIHVFAVWNKKSEPIIMSYWTKWLRLKCCCLCKHLLSICIQILVDSTTFPPLVLFTIVSTFPTEIHKLQNKYTVWQIPLLFHQGDNLNLMTVCLTPPPGSTAINQQIIGLSPPSSLTLPSRHFPPLQEGDSSSTNQREAPIITHLGPPPVLIYAFDKCVYSPL